MKRIFLLLCLAVILFQPGCAMGPPIDQQTLEHNKTEQRVKSSDAFARDLEQ